MNQLRADALVLEKLLAAKLPQVTEAFKAHELALMFVCSRWFLCLFATSLTQQTLLRVWDAMLCEGIEVVFRVAMALLAAQADAISRTNSIDTLVEILQESHDHLDPASLLKDAYDATIVGEMSKT